MLPPGEGGLRWVTPQWGIGLPDGGWTELIAVVCTRLKHYL